MGLGSLRREHRGVFTVVPGAQLCHCSYSLALPQRLVESWLWNIPWCGSSAQDRMHHHPHQVSVNGLAVVLSIPTGSYVGVCAHRSARQSPQRERAEADIFLVTVAHLESV